MNELLKKNYIETGLLHPEDLGESGTLPIKLRGQMQEIDVFRQFLNEAGEALYLPIHTRTREIVLQEGIFSDPEEDYYD